MNLRAVVILAVTLLNAWKNPSTPNGTSFRDCPSCPEMVIIPAGNFHMGSSDEEKSWAASHGGTLDSVADQAPRHKVWVASFAIGKYDITRGEYAVFVRETKHPRGDGCNISSMPKSLKRANTDNSGGRTHPVGSKPPNAFGLYDMLGNVWQWTEDCYSENYAAAPNNGSPNEAVSADKSTQDSQGNCMRVDRGSSWLYAAWLLRSTTRERNPADFRDVIMGFRVAKTLP